MILEDATWLANSIEPAPKQADPTITLIGQVNSTDPWVVSGITLTGTDDTIVTGKILSGRIVRLEILLLKDGVWDVLSITLLSNFTEIPGCATIPATVVSVNGHEVRFAGWHAITLAEEVKVENEAGQQATLGANRMVFVVVCATEKGQFMITKIILLKTNGADTSANGEKVLVCHKPDKKSGHTLSIASAAVPAHLAHGDTLGACP